MILDNILKNLIERREYLNRPNFTVKYEVSENRIIDETICSVNEIIFRGQGDKCIIELYRPNIEIPNNISSSYLTFVKIDGKEVGAWDSIKFDLVGNIEENSTVTKVLLANIRDFMVEYN